MSNRTIFALAIAAIGVVGCKPVFDNLQVAAPGGQLEVRPQVVAGGYRAQALVTPWTPEAVEHVEVRLFKLSTAGDEVPALADGKAVVQDLAKTGLGVPFTLAGLAPNSRYRLRARAYKAAGLAPEDLISDEAASFTEVTLLADDRPTVATLSIQLTDVPFDGQASVPPLEIRSGDLVPVGTESLQLGEREPE